MEELKNITGAVVAGNIVGTKDAVRLLEDEGLNRYN